MRFSRFFLIIFMLFGASMQKICGIVDTYNFVKDKVNFVKDRVGDKIDDSKYFICDHRILFTGMSFGLVCYSAIRTFFSASKALWFFNPLRLFVSGKNYSIFSVFKGLVTSFGCLTLGSSLLYYTLFKAVAQRPLLKPEFMFEPVVKVESKNENFLKEHPAVKGHTKECPLCCVDKDPSDFYKMSCCGIEFCKTCLNKHIADAIKTKDMRSLKCCRGCLMKDSDINNLANKQQLAAIKKFREIEAFDLFRHCNTPGCIYSYGINKDKNGKILQGDVLCPGCKKRYCADCQYRHLSNETCEQARERVNKKELESLTDKGRENLIKSEKNISEIIKLCPNPKCGKPIEKAKGCFHMTCKNCGLHFCWNCLGHLPIDNDHKNGGFPHKNYYDCPVSSVGIHPMH